MKSYLCLMLGIVVAVFVVGCGTELVDDSAIGVAPVPGAVILPCSGGYEESFEVVDVEKAPPCVTERSARDSYWVGPNCPTLYLGALYPRVTSATVLPSCGELLVEIEPGIVSADPDALRAIEKKNSMKYFGCKVLVTTADGEFDVLTPLSRTDISGA